MLPIQPVILDNLKKFVIAYVYGDERQWTQLRRNTEESVGKNEKE